VAEDLFRERGYQAVSLRDIGERLGITHASLYHHVPGGKEDLFVQVVEAACARHGTGLSAAIDSAPPDDLRAQLTAAGDWLLSQPPLDIVRLARTDLLCLTDGNAHRLSHALHLGLKRPLIGAVRAAQARGQMRPINPNLFVGAFLALMDGVARAPAHVARDRTVAHQLIGILLEGAATRNAIAIS
jgi:AcrR family transcriptional regulator